MQQVVPYKSSSLEKKEQVKKMFDTISSGYDRLNRLISLGMDVRWRKTLVSMALKDKPQEVLDVATGTADLAIAFSLLGVPRVTGIDISPLMIEQAKQKLVDKDLENRVNLLTGDGENLPFEDNSFDVVTVAFGVRNFQNLERGLSEIFRVIKPKGKLFILETAVPTNPIYRAGYWIYSQIFLTIVGKIFSTDKQAYTYLSKSASVFPHGKAFNQILLQQGFNSVKDLKQSLGVASIYFARK